MQPLSPPRRPFIALVGVGLALLLPAKPTLAGEVVAYEVSPVLKGPLLQSLAVRVSYAADKDGRADFQWPQSWAGEEHLSHWAQNVRFVGASKIEDAGNGRWRLWAKPGRKVSVSYSVVSAYDHDPTVNDTFNQAAPIVRPGWFYAVGEALFGAPSGRGTDAATFTWKGAPRGFHFASDLEHLGATPEQRRSAPRPGAVADVQESIALGGWDVQIFAPDDKRGVRIASRGAYAFSTPDFNKLVRDIIATERAFWGDAAEEPFLVTLAPLQAKPHSLSISGTGRTDAFALWYDTSAPFERAKTLIAHEYFHTWNARQLGGDRASATDEPLGYWFSEGFTDYYAGRMALGSGAASLETYAASWSEALKDYGLSARRLTPNREIPAGFWSDRDLQRLPYRRGALVAAVLDFQLREKDGQGLDRLMRELRAEMRGAPSVPDRDAAQVFRGLLKTQRPDLDVWVERAIENGDMLVLPADSFAPCFTLTTRVEPTFDRGFDFAATHSHGNHVVGLKPGGPADRAGLREGDLISIDEPSTPDPSVPRRYVVHEATGTTHVVTYLPAGPPTPVQSLAVAANMSATLDQACREVFGARLARK